jgi:hypothetical protein
MLGGYEPFVKRALIRAAADYVEPELFLGLTNYSLSIHHSLTKDRYTDYQDVKVNERISEK